jgi:glycerol-1-phosphate dehydrogenase [NAD(P)+]
MQGDLAVMERLVRTLVLSGFGTAIVGNSQPASQGEHLISHYIDMLAAADRPLVYHGEQVGVTTLSMARLQERMLEQAPVVQPDTETEASLKSRFGDELGASCWADFQAKRVDPQKADELNHTIHETWSSIAERVSGILLPSRYIGGVLEASGAVLTLRTSILSAVFMKVRFGTAERFAIAILSLIFLRMPAFCLALPRSSERERNGLYFHADPRGQDYRGLPSSVRPDRAP